METDPGRHLHSPAGPQKARMTEDQVGWQQAVAEQTLRSVKVGQNSIEHGCPLPDCSLNRGPFTMVQDHWDRIERPWPVGTFGIAINVVGDAVLMNQAAPLLPPAGNTRRSDRQHRIGQTAPLRPDSAVRRDELVIERRIGPVAPNCGKILLQWLRSLLLFHPNPHQFDCADLNYCCISRRGLACRPAASPPFASQGQHQPQPIFDSRMRAGGILPTRSMRKFLFKATS